MHMNFWFGTSVGDLLFKGYTITSTAGLVTTCLGLASLAMLFEAIRVYQAAMKEKSITDNTRVQSSCCPNERSALIAKEQENATPKNWLTMLGHGAVFVMEIVISYMLMLCVMTYNAYFFVAVCIGASIGYFLFGPVLLEVGLRNGGFHRSKVDCLVCKAHVQQQQQQQLQQQQQQQPADGCPQSSSIMSEVAQGLANSIMAESSGDRQLNGDSINCAVAQVHQTL